MTETTRNLSVELRPKRLSELIGQEALVEELRNGMNKRIPMAIMLVGDSGVGKTTIAEILADAVQCTHGTFGETCDECLGTHNMFQITEQNCAQYGKIENIETAIRYIHLGVSYGRYRVFIFDEAHEIGKKAQEVLYIPMEDKDSQNIFIFPTTDPSKIELPIKRRCKIFQVPGLYPAAIHQLVESTIIRAEGSLVKPVEPLVSALIKADITSSGFIVTAVERYLDGVPPELAVFVKDGSRIDMGALIGAVKRGNWTKCQAVLRPATAADADGLKLVLSGAFRNILLDPESSVARTNFAAAAIHELSGNNASVAYETGFQLNILVASIYKICQMVNTAAAAASAGAVKVIGTQPFVN